MEIERECGCGSTEWTLKADVDYPERLQERDRTVKEIYVCNECGTEGRRFVHQNGGPDIYSGAFR
jgi:hypothetical protein